MTLTIIAIIFIAGITVFITLTFAAYQEWRIKMFERQILRCFKTIRSEFQRYKKEINLEIERMKQKCK